MLQTLAQRYPTKLTRAQVGRLAGFTPSGGTFGNYFSALKRYGLIIEASNGDVEIAEAGLPYLGSEVPLRDISGWFSRPDAEARTRCRAYAIMRADREELSAGEVARTVAHYQQIGAHRPDTPWLGVSRMTTSLTLVLSISGVSRRLTGSHRRPQP